MNLCDPCNPDSEKSLCDGDCKNNIWFINGKCRLDQLTYDQVIFILQRNPQAKPDLLRVTTDPCLVRVALDSSLIQSQIQQDLRPYNLINNPKNTLPFYKLFRGNLNGGF